MNECCPLQLVMQHEENISTDNSENTITGYLSKWTNYVHGWQKRFVVLKNGSLSYYKSEEDLRYGSRGSIKLQGLKIKVHEIDDCRFDVLTSDYSWFLRATSPADKDLWVDALSLKSQVVDSGYGSVISVARKDSDSSLKSTNLSGYGYLADGKSDFQEKLINVETLKNILSEEVESAEKLLEDGGGGLSGSPDIREGVDELKVRLRAVKAIANNLIDSIGECVLEMSEREEKLASEAKMEKMKRMEMEEACRLLMTTESDRTEQEEENDWKKSMNDLYCDVSDGGDKTHLGNGDKKGEEVVGDQIEVIKHIRSPSAKLQAHRLWPEIDRITLHQVKYAQLGLGDGVWQLFADEGEMKMYKREEEKDGLVVDPLMACHFVRGFTAREICDYFFKPEYRLEWETTLDEDGMEVLERISEDCLIFHQIHKRIWPSQQRDSLFWSHLRQVPSSGRDKCDINDNWIVVNQSTEVDSHPKNTGKYIRVDMTISLYCETNVLPCGRNKSLQNLTRDDVACKITYCAVVNPGGWTPAAALRLVYKKEYPKFLRKFTAYVADKTKNKPLKFEME